MKMLQVAQIVGLRRLNGRLFVALAVLPLAACQIVAPQQQTAPRLSIDRSAVAANSGDGAATAITTKGLGSDLTYTVKRGTIRDSLSIAGKVVPTRAAQLEFQSSGAVSAVYVRSGQSVNQGDALADLTLDDAAIESARTRATLADLAYGSQQAKVDELRRGASADALEAARAAVAKAEIEVRKLQLARSSGDANGLESGASPAAQAADQDVALAQLSLQQAEDDLREARAAVARIAEQAKNGASATAAALRTAQRSVQAAQVRLDQAKAQPNVGKAKRDLLEEQIALEQANLDLREAKDYLANTDIHPPDPTGLIGTQAVKALGDAGRRVSRGERRVQQAQMDLEAAKAANRQELQLAQLALDQANDDLARAQADDDAARKGLPVATSSQAALDLPTAQARVRDAERRVQIETIKLQAAQSQADIARDTRNADLDLQAKQADLASARAKLAELQKGPAGDELARETRRSELLRDEADRARMALQGVVQVRAPFSGTVASVDVRVGQRVDGRTTAVRMAGTGEMSVTANASETDVTQLGTDQQVQISFPGVPDVLVTGTIVDVAGAATQGGGSRDQALYPIQVDLSSVPQGVKLGMTAMLNVNLREAKDVLYAPANAVRRVNGQAVVTTVDSGGQVADTPVRVGGTLGGDVEIISGVNEGDVLAVFTPATAGTGATAKRP